MAEGPAQNGIPDGLTQRLRLYFGTGLLLLLPIAITFFLLKLVFDFLDGILQPVLEFILGTRVPGAGLAALILLILVVGMIGSARLGSRAVGIFQALLLKLPLVRNVYAASTQLMDVFSGNQARDDAKRVVVIEYPRPGLWSIGFLMAVTADENGRSMGVVYIPTAPMPNSGWVAVLPLSDVYETDLTVQQTSQIVLSAGLLVPSDLPKRPLQQRLVDALQSEIVTQRQELEARRHEVEELQARLSNPGLAESAMVEELRRPDQEGTEGPSGRRSWLDRWRRGER